ncbi:MAG: tRNA pseudouridine(55) synthase TruB, partial [Synergistota bacterium]|nr:tRNA pseudouridine(55) synthase TruB [Synergistota bacterium]
MDSGFLNLWKPEGVRSSWCVHEAKKLLPRGVKIGHGGTLDSTAEGVLVLLVGKATRLSRYVMALPKTYVVRLRLGVETDTLDASGKIVQEKPFGFVDETMIDVELCRFMGPIMQRPPAVSAIRLQGKRSHSLARSGATVCHRERPVFVRSIRRLTNIRDNGEVTLEIVCGKGTYVRSIVRDLGRNLGACAVTVRLCRVALGPYSRVMACDLAAITDNNDISKSLAPF